MNLSPKIVATMVVIALLTVTGCNKASQELGSRDNPIKIYFTPSVDAETITTNSLDFLKYLEKKTGFIFTTGIPTSYVAVVEALGSERADIAVMNSFGYLMANEKYGAQAKLTTIRHGEKFYKGQIITHVDSGIDKIEDLAGKSFAFVDPSSTSGYLFPLKIINEKNIELGNKVFASKHDNAVTMVYQKQVDAAASFYSPASKSGEIRDARARVKEQFPDVEEKVKIISLTDDIPNDPFVFRKNLPQSVTDKTIAAILEYLDTPKGKEVFKEIYGVDEVVKSTDSDYDKMREMIKVNNLDPATLLK